MKSNATLKIETQNVDLLYDLLKSEDYNFKPKELSIEIVKNNIGVEILIYAQTPQLLKIATSAVCDSCEVIRKTKMEVKRENE